MELLHPENWVKWSTMRRLYIMALMAVFGRVNFSPNHRSTVASVMRKHLAPVCITSLKYALLPTIVTEHRKPATLYLSIYPLSRLKHKTYKCKYYNM